MKRVVNVLLPIFWTAFCLLAAQFIVAVPLVKLAGTSDLSPVLQTIYSALVYALALVLLIFGGKKLRKSWKTSREGLGLRALPTWTDLGLAPVAFIVYIFIAGALMTAFENLFPWFNSTEKQDVGFNYLTSGSDKVIAFLALCLIAPVMEELIFRGWLYGKLRDKIDFNKPKKSKKLRVFLNIAVPTLLTSLLFGFMHSQWNVGINVFAMSLVLCVMREITGTIYSGVLLHMIKNAVAFYLVFVLGIG